MRSSCSSGAGKSHWARAQFDASQIVSSDALRALVGDGPHDQRAGTDAFAMLDQVVDRRLRRGLLTVVDSLALDDDRRASYVALARRHGVRCCAVAFDTDPATCRARNRRRDPPVPATVVGRFRLLADAGVHTVIVSLTDLEDERAVGRFAPVIEAFMP